MQTSQQHQSSGHFHGLCQQLPMQQIEPYCFPPFQILNTNSSPNNDGQSTQLSFQSCDEQFFTLESSPATDSSAVSMSSYQTPSCASDQHQSPDNTYGSPASGSSTTYGCTNELENIIRNLENELLGPQPNEYDTFSPNQSLDMKQLLLYCAKAISEEDFSTAEGLIKALEGMVSVSGEPIQRLGAYMLEGLRARLLSSGSIIYKKLKCNEPISSTELMTYMSIISQICPYYKFAYSSANAVIHEAMENESKIHIIDFQIAQGSQWKSLIELLAKRPGGPPNVRVTGIDDSQSAHARGGGLHIVGQGLAEFARSRGVLLEFHAAAMDGCEVELENLGIRHGEALAVNFPYMLHHMPDESVTTRNHRDRLLRLVKSLSPKVVTLVEQESNTNTSSFLPRFQETLDYYTAMFESIDAAYPRDDKQRISTEEHCVARDIVNIIACEGAEREERHELFGKWRSRLMMAGFTPCPLSPQVGIAVMDVLKKYSKNYRLEERGGVLYLSWKNRAMVTTSAWR